MAASITDDIKARVAKRGPACAIGTWLDEQPPKRRSEFVAAMADKTITNRAIADWLADRQGVTVVANTVGYHRRGECITCRRAGHLKAS